MRRRQGVPKSFTASRLAGLPAGRYKDPGQHSLYLLVREKLDGQFSRTWLHRVKLKGGDTYIQIGHFPATSLEQARHSIREQRELLSKGIDPRRAAPRRRELQATPSVSAASARDPHSIEFLATEFMDRYVKPHRKRPEYVQAILDKDVLPLWKGRDARTIKPREVIELLDGIVERGSPVAANRTAAMLVQLFKFGIHRAIVDDSPVKLLMRPGGKEEPRERALSDAELRIFLERPLACTRQRRLAHVVTLLLLTGQRRGELAQARWRDIDFPARTWTIPAEHSKTGRENVVPLTDWAVELFESFKHAPSSPWVLPGTDATEHLDAKLLTRSLAKCMARFQKVGILAFTLHDLRRTCRTGLARLKVEPHIAERVLGHAQERIRATYDTHVYLDEKRAALELWSAHLATLIIRRPLAHSRSAERKGDELRVP